MMFFLLSSPRKVVADLDEMANFDIIEFTNGVSYMGPMDLNGWAAIVWSDGDVYVGPMKDGRRFGSGLLYHGITNTVTVVEWLAGEDLNWEHYVASATF